MMEMRHCRLESKGQRLENMMKLLEKNSPEELSPDEVMARFGVVAAMKQG
jgi:hypothetical protein